MKFSDKYPHMKPIIDEAPNFIIRGTEMKPCVICKEPTEFIYLDFECHVCSEECQDTLEYQYMASIMDGMEE